MHLFWKLKPSLVFDPSLNAEGRNILAASNSHIQGLVSAAPLRPPQAVLSEKLPEFPSPSLWSLFRQVCCSVATDFNNLFRTQSSAPVSTERDQKPVFWREENGFSEVILVIPALYFTTWKSKRQHFTRITCICSGS